MSTDAQILANRENAEHSTGPQTAAGKAASCMNNFRFGFTGAFKVLDSEDQDEFDSLFHALSVEHQVTTTTESILVLKMAQHFWLSQRAQSLQDTVMGDPALTALEQERQFALFLRYQTTNDRAFTRSLHDLLKLRAERRKAEIGFESQERKRDEESRKEAEESRRQAAEKRRQDETALRQRAEDRKQELHKHAVSLAEAKVFYQEALAEAIETRKVIDQALHQREMKTQKAA